MIPRPPDRVALEDGRDDAGGHVQSNVDHDGHDCTGKASVLRGRDDAEIEEEDGQFGKIDGEFVEDLGGPKRLLGESETAGGQSKRKVRKKCLRQARTPRACSTSAGMRVEMCWPTPWSTPGA